MSAPVTTAPAPTYNLPEITTYDEAIKVISDAERTIAVAGDKAHAAHFTWLYGHAVLFTQASDTEDVARRETWTKVCADKNRKSKKAPSDVSFLKKVCILDVTGKYLGPWADGDFTVTLRQAYDALRGKLPTVKNSQSIDNILKAAQKKIRKLHSDKVANVTLDRNSVGYTLTVELL